MDPRDIITMNYKSNIIINVKYYNFDTKIKN